MIAKWSHITLIEILFKFKATNVIHTWNGVAVYLSRGRP